MKNILRKALALLLAALLCISMLPLAALADEFDETLSSFSEGESQPHGDEIPEETDENSPEGESPESFPEDYDEGLGESYDEASEPTQDEIDSRLSKEIFIAINELEEKEVEPTDDTPIYISNIALGIADGAEKAKKHLTDRGMEVFDQDLNAGTGRDHVFIGYSTTTNPERALTDIRVCNLSQEALSTSEAGYVNMGGIPYVGAIMILDEGSKLSSSTFGGGFVMASSTTRDDFAKTREILHMVGGALLDLSTFGLFSIGKMIYDHFWQYDRFLGLYATRDPRAGTPILADFIFDRSNRVAPPEYEAVAKFGSDVAADLNNDQEDEGYKRNYLFYKTGIDYTQSENPDYVSDIRFYRYIPYANPHLPTEGTTRAEELYEDAATPHWETEGYTAIEENIYRGIEPYVLYLTYKTTKNPYRAITDIKYVNTSDTDTPPEFVGNREIATYTPTHNIITPYAPTKKDMDPYDENGEYTYLRHENHHRTYTGHADLGRSVIYTTTSPNAGVPIEPEFLLSDTKQDLTEEWQPVSSFLETTPADITTGSGSSVEYFIYFKRNSRAPELGKYYSGVELTVKKTRAQAVFTAMEKGYDGILDLKIPHRAKEGSSIMRNESISPAGDIYLMYKRSDSKAGAVTGFITTHNKATLETTSGGKGKYWTDLREKLVYDSSIKHNNVTYEELGRVSDMWFDSIFISEYAGNDSDYKPRDTSVGDFIVLYYTTSTRLGKPIVDISQASTALSNGYDNVVYNTDGNPSDLTQGSGVEADSYLAYNRDGFEPAKYVTELMVSAHSGQRDAIFELVNGGMKFMASTDFNRDTGKDYIYLGYKKSNSSSDAITGLLATYDKKWQESIEHEGITYLSASKVDFNKGTGGDDIFLYYTKDKKAGEPIVDIETSDFRLLNGYNEIVYYTNGDTADFSKSSKTEKDIFLLFNRTTDQPKAYISELGLQSGGEAKEAFRLLFEQNIKSYVDYDLNKDTGKDFIYLGYNKTDNESEAITGLVALYDQKWQESISYNGVKYTPVSKTDINKGTGGKDIFLYYTKDRQAGEPITELRASNYQTLRGSYEEIVYTTEGTPSDFTKSSGTERDIYLIVTRGAVSSPLSDVASVFAPPSLWFILIFIGIITAAGVSIAIIRKKSKARGQQVEQV